MQSILTIRGASHSYDGRRWQFRNLDLDLQPGKIVAILGQNGQGKSTLLRAIAGLLRLNSGQISTHAPFGFVPQDFAGSFPYSVLDIVLMGRARHVPLFRNPTPEDEKAALAALSATGMHAYAQRSFTDLSGGERQLVLIARAVAGQNSGLLLDEPASALDLRNQDAVLALMRDLAHQQGLAIAFTTHQPNHALAIADQVLLMKHDAPALFGPADEILNDENLEALFGIPVRTVAFDDAGISRKTMAPIFLTGTPHRPDRQGS